jgi:uncharacterized SAM-binding protein YcdF (DUF218 family)
MFFFLSKTLDLLFAPLTWSLVLAAASAWTIHRGRRRIALATVVAAVAVLLAFSSTSVARALLRALEASAETTMSPTTTYDVVVVLGGITSASSTPEAPEFAEGVDRLLAGYDLVRRNRARYILVSSDTEETRALARQLSDWGVASDRVLVDDRGHNTHDNATGSAKIIRDRGLGSILLVTSAFHMTRAAGCFRAVGLTFDTLAVDHLVPARADAPQPFGPRADALYLSTLALREALGRIVYRANGYAR